MLRYFPPKSNCWGHGLRSMKPSQQLKAINEFEKEIVKSTELVSYDIDISYLVDEKPDKYDEYVDYFAQKLNKPRENQIAGESPFYNFEIDSKEFTKAIKALIEIEREIKSTEVDFSISKSYKITKWKLGEKVTKTDSSFYIYYGTRPSLYTEFRFNSEEEFDSLQEIFTKLKLCKLNPKHLKEEKRRRA